jgi:hypothetical protein
MATSGTAAPRGGEDHGDGEHTAGCRTATMRAVLI